MNGPIGTVLQDTATLTGSSGATGSIEFKLYATADCSGAPVDDETTIVTGDGSYATTTGYTAPAAGTKTHSATSSTLTPSMTPMAPPICAVGPSRDSRDPAETLVRLFPPPRGRGDA